MTCLAHGLLQETAVASVLNLKISFFFFMFICIGLAVQFCIVPFGPLIFLLVFVLFFVFILMRPIKLIK